MHSSRPAISRLLLNLPYRIYRDTKDPTIQRKYLDTLSRYDVQASLDAYASHIQENPDAEILFDYILLLKANGDYAAALAATKTLLEHAGDPLYRLVECDLLAALGHENKALAAYENLIRDELASKNDLDILALIISKYRQYLQGTCPRGGSPPAVPDYRFTGCECRKPPRDSTFL